MKALISPGTSSQRRFLFLACFPIICFTRQSFAQTTDLYEGSLDRTAPRGTHTVESSVPGNRPPEIGIVSKHLPFGDYRGENGSKDIADEQELVRYDFYKLCKTAADGAGALCPKEKRTTAAVQLFPVPDKPPKFGPETPASFTPLPTHSKD